MAGQMSGRTAVLFIWAENAVSDRLRRCVSWRLHVADFCNVAKTFVILLCATPTISTLLFFPAQPRMDGAYVAD